MNQPEALYSVIDGALVDNLPKLLTRAKNYTCLYRGKLPDWQREIAPYLLSIEENPEILAELLANSWHPFWGIFISSKLPIKQLRVHLRKFQLTKIENHSSQFLFRYYDPRVFPTFASLKSSEIPVKFFSEIHTVLCPTNDPNLLITFTEEGGTITTQLVASSSLQAFARN